VLTFKMAYQMSNGENSHALGESVDSLLEKTATLNSSFDNNGFQEALQNVCQQQVGKNLPIWPRGLKTATRPALDKSPQQAISASISATFGRPWNAEQNDPGLFISTAEMHPTQVNYVSEAMAQMSPELMAAASTVALAPAAAPVVPMKPPAMMMQMPPKASATAPDSDCGFSDPNFSVWRIPACMVKSLAGIPQSKNFFTDHSRYFYLLCWLGIILLVVFLFKKFLIQKPPQQLNPVFFPPQYE